MKINQDLINDIFLLKKKITSNKDKLELSQYQEVIPLYDIYTHYVYPINFQDVENKVLNHHFRFISEPQVATLRNYIKKLSKQSKLNNLEKIFLDKMKYNLRVLDNYIIKELEKTSIQAFYYGSIKFGQSISICRRKSFHPKLNHLTPYYSLKELIKLGQNNNLLQEKLTPIQLQDEKLHYQICQKVGDNDISFLEILKNSEFLENHYSLIKFLSIYGSSFVNENYRKIQQGNKPPFPQYLELGEKINNLFNKSPGLDRDYYFYRFIWEDSFIKHLKIGDIFIDGGILSTTRNPFYSPEMMKNFGLILLKITVPKKFDKLLMLETISGFPQEQEIILPSFTKMKLISKEDKFKYYHIDEKYQNLITKRYHFQVIGQEAIPSYIKPTYHIPELNLDEIILGAPFINNRLKEFVTNYTSEINLFKINNKIFQAITYDPNSSYAEVFSQEDEESLLIFELDKTFSIKNSFELSDKLVFNYQNKHFPENNLISEDELLELLVKLGKIFGYSEAKIYLNYERENLQNYPVILREPRLPFKNYVFYQNISLRDFITELNRKIPKEITTDIFHLKELDDNKNISWQNLFIKYIENNQNVSSFYNDWNKYNEFNLPDDLYLLLNLNTLANEEINPLPYKQIIED